MHFPIGQVREQIVAAARIGRHEQSQQTSLAALDPRPDCNAFSQDEAQLHRHLETERCQVRSRQRAIQALVVEVEHNEPVFRYLAKGLAGGQQFEQEVLTTDGKPGQDSRGATVVTKWDGDALVTQATGGDGSPLCESRMSMSPDGNTITRVFVRKKCGRSPDTPRNV
jgi:hypothetical protein